MRAFVFALLAAAAVVLGAACGGGDNWLGGSVSELFPLEISRTEILRNEQAFQVSYYRNRGTEVDLVVRLNVALDGVDFAPGKKIDLAGEYAHGHQRATVLHIAGGEPAHVLPHVRSGDLVLSAGGNPGEDTRGNFSISFEQTTAYGGGRTVYGNFRGMAQDAGFDPVGP
ncbi:MAG: hypothetical protein IRZ16_15985 [Myxococcaceae bacterium]|nr:hypothetical protein [Myxococcaceae bacterium]